jgi:riboflavin transporter FmnP
VPFLDIVHVSLYDLNACLILNLIYNFYLFLLNETINGYKVGVAMRFDSPKMSNSF